MIDLTRTVQTTDGRAVRVLATNLTSVTHPVAAAVMTNGVEEVYGYTLEGHLVPEDGTNPLDLVQAPVLDADWVNYYGATNEVFKTSEGAQHYAAPGRLALFKVTTTDGVVTGVQLVTQA